MQGWVMEVGVGGGVCEGGWWSGGGGEVCEGWFVVTCPRLAVRSGLTARV